MARANTITKLPLDRWAQLVGLNPMHFNGVYVPSHPPTVCEQPWMQHPYQAVDRVGREDVAQAIAQAESDLEKELSFRLRPTWEVSEWRPTIRPWNPAFHNLSVTDLRGFGPVAQAKWGYFISGGIRSKEVVDAGVTVVWSDADGDGYNETGTVTVAAVAFTDPCEAALYFPVAGPVTEAGDDRWQIRPVNASIASTNLTVTFRREQTVLAATQERLIPPTDDSHLRGVDGTDNNQFLTTVDVYRVYNDPQLQVQFLWEPKGCALCNGTGCEGCSYSVQYGCLMIRDDPRHSIVSYRPATWNEDTWEFDVANWSIYREPDLVRLYYYAGWRDTQQDCPTLSMDPIWERAVAYYAASLLDRPVCECNNVGAYIDQWREELARTSVDGVTRRLSEADLRNPFGTKRGAIFAWNRMDEARHEAVRV